MRERLGTATGRWKIRPRLYDAPSEEALWRSIYFFNLYRLTLGILLAVLFGKFGNTLAAENRNLALSYNAAVIYALLALGTQVLVKLRKPRFNRLLALQVGVDIVCMVVLTYASGGIQGGLGILLLVSLAASGLISRGKITLFFAALASIAMLLEHSYAILTSDADVAQYLQVGLLSIAYFAVAWVANVLARYAVASEKLAMQRGVALASMAEVNRLVIQGMPDGVLVIDERGVIKQYNPSAERLLGRNLSLHGSMTVGACAPQLADLLSAWRRDPSRDYQEVRFQSSNNLARARFLPVQHEDFGGVLVFLEDMKRAQEQAQQIKLAALGRLTASIAHEIRNPLSAISYAAELFQEDRQQDTGHDRLVQIILDNTTRLNRIVQDVMQLNRRDRAQSEPLVLADELNSFTREVCQVEHVGQDVFQLDVAADCHVNFDRGHFNQVLWNLCSNAMRHCSRQPGSISLRGWRSGGGRIMLDVMDDGAGVAAEDVPQLFEPFFTTAASGTGLGLYIARQLCEANGATLEYIQQAQQGACFRINFGGLSDH